MSWGQERAENILRPCWTKHLRSSVYSASSFQDALVLLSNLRFSQKTITHPTFHFCILVYVLLQSGIVKITRNERVHNVLLLICWLALDPLWVLRFLGCWSMSDDCVDQGSFMCSQLKSENNFFLNCYCWMAVLKPLCEALSGRLFIVLHGQTQRMVFFFSVSTQFYVNI